MVNFQVDAHKRKQHFSKYCSLKADKFQVSLISSNLFINAEKLKIGT